MPTVRRPLKIAPNPIISEGALNLWRRLRHITYQQKENTPEAEGGRQAEFISAIRQFNTLFGLDQDPAAFPVIFASSSEPPEWMSTAQAESYLKAHTIYNLFERWIAEDDARREQADDYARV